MPNQFLRKVGLVVTTGSTGLDLSNMRIRFKTQAMHDGGAPNTAWIRVYNLKEDTANSISTAPKDEFKQVSLQAGYENGNYAVIFSGQVMQVKKGKESNVDSYVDIMAADAIEAHTFSFLSKSIDSARPADQGKIISDELSKYGVKTSPNATAALSSGGAGGITLSRGKVAWGLAGARLNELADSTATTWSIQNGVLEITPRNGYKAGDAIELNSQTGMIGMPESTEQGIQVKCLLNPLLGCGIRVKINNKDINQTSVMGGMYPKYGSIPLYARVTEDGTYRVLVAEHSGDTRGQEWYTDIVCLSLDGAN